MPRQNIKLLILNGTKIKQLGLERKMDLRFFCLIIMTLISLNVFGQKIVEIDIEKTVWFTSKNILNAIVGDTIKLYKEPIYSDKIQNYQLSNFEFEFLKREKIYLIMLLEGNLFRVGDKTISANISMISERKTNQITHWKVSKRKKQITFFYNNEIVFNIMTIRNYSIYFEHKYS